MSPATLARQDPRGSGPNWSLTEESYERGREERTHCKKGALLNTDGLRGNIEMSFNYTKIAEELARGPKVGGVRLSPVNARCRRSGKTFCKDLQGINHLKLFQ